MVRVIGMARVSSQEQASGNALEQQIQRLKDHGATEIISIIGSRSKQIKNKDYLYLLDLMENYPNPSELKIIVTRFDRIGTLASIKTFVDVAVKNKILLTALDQAIDLTTVMGRAFASMLGVISDIEVEGNSDRIKHGHAHHQNRGAAYFPIFGYKKVGDVLELSTEPFLSCDESEWSKADIARYRIDLLLMTGSLGRTVALYNEKFGLYNSGIGQGRGNRLPRGGPQMSIGGFGNWLANPILRGHIAYGRKSRGRLSNEADWKFVYDVHPALITESEWSVIKILLATNIKKNGECGNSATRPFAGLVRCQCCNRAMTSASFRLPSNHDVKKYSYKCVSHRRKQGCDQSKGIREEVVRDAIVKKLVDYASEIYALESVSVDEKAVSPEITLLESQINDLKSIPNPTLPILNAIQQMRKDLYQLITKEKLDNSLEGERKQELIEVFQDPLFWTEFMEKKLTPTEVRTAYQKWIKVIWIKDGQVIDIELNF